MLRTVDPAFSTVVDSGLMWEVLDWMIEAEEPDGCSTIQAALNAKNGLFLLTHEMQAVAKLTTITFASAMAERTISASLAQARLRSTLPAFADDEHFLELYRFIVELVGDGAPFIQDLRSFHERLIDPQVRKIRLSVLGCMNLLALDMPHLKVAGVKFVYEAWFLRSGEDEACEGSHGRAFGGREAGGDSAELLPWPVHPPLWFASIGLGPHQGVRESGPRRFRNCRWSSC
jgi:hypothetical protein